MAEKKAQKEEEEKAKEKRKEERIQKRKHRDEQKQRKKAELDAKRRKKADERHRKREMRERLLQTLEDSDGGSEDEIQVSVNNCYQCEKPYTSDFIECSNCSRRFHITCISDDYMGNVDGLEFECKFC